MQADLEANKNVIRQYLQLLEQGDVKAAGDLVADDVQWWVLGPGYMPKQALLGIWGQMFGAMSKKRAMRPTGMVAEGDRVAAEFEGEFELVDGRTFLNHFNTVFTLANGKIVAAREYMDTALMEKLFGQH
jgi:uncharacterized protein